MATEEKEEIDIAIFPTSYFPPIALMAAMVQWLSRAESKGALLLEQMETFAKQSHRNRTVIVTAAGRFTLSVPVERPNGNHTRTGDIAISYAERWNVNHWRAIESAYNSSPYFLYYRDGIESILMKRHRKLSDLNEELLMHLLKKMKIDAQITHTEDYRQNYPSKIDYRGRYSYKRPEALPPYPAYQQVFSDRMPFQANVGILDLLFNLGPESRDYLMQITT